MTMGMWNDENGEKCLTKNTLHQWDFTVGPGEGRTACTGDSEKRLLHPSRGPGFTIPGNPGLLHTEKQKAPGLVSYSP